MIIYKKLSEIQQKLKAPKGQYNSFGKYAYRSCEDILEAVKPLLGELTLTITDDIVLIGTRYYIKAIATVSNGEESVSVSAMAREDESRKGMDSSQLTGSTSSYARKYALNGLFCIDDQKDSDNTNQHNQKPTQQKPTPQKAKNLDALLGFIKLLISTNKTTKDGILLVLKIKDSTEIASWNDKEVDEAFSLLRTMFND